jgi:hypothetical protein
MLMAVRLAVVLAAAAVANQAVTGDHMLEMARPVSLELCGVQADPFLQLMWGHDDSLFLGYHI